MYTLSERREKLKQAAQNLLGPGSNKCQGFAELIELAVAFSAGQANQVETVVEDLKAVLIGDSLVTGHGRSQGPFFKGNSAGAKGFKPELRDNYDQVQHAMAGLYMGYRLPSPALSLVMGTDGEMQDAKLYGVMMGLGRGLTAERLHSLPAAVRRVMGDETCQQSRPHLYQRAFGIPLDGHGGRLSGPVGMQ
jgi:hypothetical protein